MVAEEEAAAAAEVAVATEAATGTGRLLLTTVGGVAMNVLTLGQFLHVSMSDRA